MKREYISYIEDAEALFTEQNRPDLLPVDRMEVARQLITMGAALELAAFYPDSSAVRLTRIQLSTTPDKQLFPEESYTQPLNPLDAIVKAIGALLSELDFLCAFRDMTIEEREAVIAKFTAASQDRTGVSIEKPKPEPHLKLVKKEKKDE